MIERLLGHDFPGNIRELRNTIERAVILACEGNMHPDHIVLDSGEKGPAETLGHLIQRRGRLTDQMVLDALAQSDGHRSRAAQQLNVSKRILYHHLKRLRIG